MRLIDRQKALLEHLVAPMTFRREGGGQTPELAGLPSDRLRIVGEQALAKRMSKVRAVFPQTCKALGNSLAETASAFADACPPTSIERWDNAKQFHDHLVESWETCQPDLPYLPDLLAFEAALWMARQRLEERIPVHHSTEDMRPDRRLICAHDISVLALDYDIRALMTHGPSGDVPRRSVFLVIRRARIGAPAKVFEIPPIGFDILRRLREGVRSYAEISSWADVEGERVVRDLMEIGAIVSVS